MLVAGGITNVENLLSGDADGKKYTQIAVGTSDTPVTGSETALTGQVNIDIDSSNIFAGGFIQFNGVWASGLNDGFIAKEMGLVNEDGVLTHRLVITPVTKIGAVTYALSYKIKIS